jgi:GNAT superfamily N-acetyltransferase
MNDPRDDDKPEVKATWRILALNDIQSVFEIASKIHPSLPERKEVYAERTSLFPEGCFALVDCENDELYGYAISHPIVRYGPPAIDSLLGMIAVDADQYYIHDLAILPDYQGHGYAKDGLKLLLEVAKCYDTTSLVSVYGTAPFWSRFGFEPVEIDKTLQTKLLDYGEDAVFLERRN